jgi:hypothetical protein
VNVALAEEIMGLILMEPERFDMGVWFDTSSTAASVEFLRDCGTTACIAGHAVLLTAPAGWLVWVPGAVATDGYGPTMMVRPDGSTVSVSEAARVALGLDKDVADVLFTCTATRQAVPALKFLIGNPDATDEGLLAFLSEGRDAEAW